ncbi:triple tyrosine motif-containing protein [Riemerella anatipestifer]|nr:triple tyrosine motif-containing protein [Riemerella anatipestifer]MCO4304649.1 hypothetical protein [Riemerella anatipestifer]MCO7353518.1 hypothetical protein [Riemerella anatipestifer]MCQ4039997.1 hypothetical protein [Riemerella anatipestifer]MCT6761634.1 hypothetical protein [Riemerella anatipestifer]MCT6765496.1 hypothetical protein [Riemerella anatipestifer]
MMLRAFSIIFFCLFSSNIVVAQHIPQKGLPFIHNFLPEDYGNHGKVWDIKISANGLVYMASDNGLLEFDGQKWKRFRNYKGYTRSLHIANDSNVYIGADKDFGIWKKNALGNFNYTSLYPFSNAPKSENEEFWNIGVLDNKTFFISHENIYIYGNKKLKKIPAPSRFVKSFYVNNKLFLADRDAGLFYLEGEKLKLLCRNPQSNFNVSAIYKLGADLYIVSQNYGIYKYKKGQLASVKNQVADELIKYKTFSFTKVGERYLAFGTILNGLYITDLNGNVVQHLNKNKGLPNNTVLCLEYAPNGDLWLGLDYGISRIELNNTKSYFYDTSYGFGTAHTAHFSNNRLYIGTNQGLYYTDWERLNNSGNESIFRIIPRSEGQVWVIKNIDGHILVGHDKGLYEINSNLELSKKPSSDIGVLSIEKLNSSLVLVGTYNGIYIYKKEQEDWLVYKKLDSILGAVNQIVVDGNTYWANIPNYGLIRFNLDKNFTPINRIIFNAKQFEGYFPYIYKHQNKIYIETSKYSYLFDKTQRKFQKQHHRTIPSIKGLLSGVYKPIMLNDKYGFYPINNGFVLENKLQKANLVHYPLQFREARSFNNEETIRIAPQSEFAYHLNNVKFTYLVPNADVVSYQYFLEGFSEQWSDWSPKSQTDFINLREGNYILKVRTKQNNQISEVYTFAFRIQSPWYRSWWAYLCYIIVLLGGVFFIKRYQTNRLRKQRLELLKKEQNSLREQAEKHRQELVLHKKNQLEKEKELLLEKVKEKTIELANKAKEDDDKMRLLGAIKEKIETIQNNPNLSNRLLKEVRRDLETYLNTEDNTFEIQMDELHQEFFRAMKAKFPNLSIYDLRLCAYLKIGLTSKEMSDILQVLPSSINVSRSRLRKKLGLKPDEDLYEFLNKI